MTSRSSKKGFTLVEILLVFGIIGILATLAIYTYISQLGKIRLNNSIKSLNSALQLAKMRAATTSMPYGVLMAREGGDSDFGAPGRIYIFVDCDRNHAFTDNDGNPSNNPTINSPTDCPNDRDALLREQPYLELERWTYFAQVLGDKSSDVSVVFTELGYCMQGNNFVDGEIYIQNNNDREGNVDSAGITILGATGATENQVHTIVDKDAWK